MSTFSGIINEIPFISVDRFDGINRKSRVFFLSHCHTDHMVGLETSEDLPVQTGVPFEIEYTRDSETYKFVVTLIPAGHCPGSVMFLFEYKDQRILYTGDFRMSISSLRKVRYFKFDSSHVLKFNNIYIDSTFLRKAYQHFPTQFQSVEIICNIIEKWIRQSSNHLVLIKLPARYGLEYLSIEVAKRVKMKIHINPDEYAVYKCISEMENCFTINAYETQVHACVPVMTRKKGALDCRSTKSDEILIIRPTAWFWANWNNTTSITTDVENNVIRVCYSSHASFTEIHDMMIYLKPESVQLNVLPENREERDEMLNEAKKLLAKFQNLSGVQHQIYDEYVSSKFDNIRSRMTLKKARKESEDEASNSDNELINIPIKQIKT